MSDESLSKIIGMIYEASIKPKLWPDVLRQLAIDTPSVAVIISSHDMLARTSSFHQSFGLDPEYMKIYNERWNINNPLISAVTLLEPGEVSGLPALVDFEAFKRHPFYLEWGKPQGYNDTINVMLERTPTRLASLSLIRNHEQGLADAATIERLRILAPHFLRAIRIGRVLEHASVQEDTLLKTLDALASAVFLLGLDGKLVHANASALKLVENGLTYTQVVGAFIRFLKSSKNLTSRASVLQSLAGEFSFKIEVGSGVFVCHSLPLSLSDLHLNQPNRSLMLVVVQNATLTRSGVTAVASMFGLTGRERDVLLGLVEIGGVAPTAAMLGLSKETVKSHLKSVFQKTQTNRQSDLVKIVFECLSPFKI